MAGLFSAAANALPVALRGIDTQGIRHTETSRCAPQRINKHLTGRERRPCFQKYCLNDVAAWTDLKAASGVELLQIQTTTPVEAPADGANLRDPSLTRQPHVHAEGSGGHPPGTRRYTAKVLSSLPGS